MTKIFLFLFLFFASSSARAAGLTLEDVYKSAVKNTETVSVAESRLRQSESQSDRIRGGFLPALSIGANYQRQSETFSSTGEYDQGSTKLTLSQSLYAGGRDKANLGASKANAEAQRYGIVNARNSLYIEIARVFYALLSAEREVENTNKSIELTQKRIEELQKRKKIGKSRNIEILASQAQLSVLQAQLVAGIADRRIAKNNFSNTTGLDRNTELVDNLTLPDEVKNLKSLLQKSKDRPDILGLQASLESSELLVSAAKSGYLPTLDLTANYYPSRYHFQSTAQDWDVGLTLTFPLYSGGITSASVREAQEVKLQTELLLRQAKRSAETEIHTAYNNLVSSLEQIKALEKAVSATEQNYKEQEKDYRFSLATNLDVLQALNTFYETKRSLDRTRYLALSSAAELKAAVNDLDK